jgi:spore coat polysaccharide biosynthesis predicted glycosyltransferase SpsG
MSKFLCILSNPSEFGNGHNARQQILKKEIEKNGYKYDIILNSQDLENMETKKGTVLILDLSNRDIEPKEKFFKNFEKSVGFDWSGSFIPDINIVILEHPGYKYKFKKIKYVGLKHLIVNDKYYIKNFEKSGKSFILISLGFKCESSNYIKAIVSVRKFSRDQIIIASGLPISIPDFENVKVLVNPLNFYELILDAELVVSNGGTTMIEALHAGKEVIPLPQSLDESRFTTEVSKFVDQGIKFPGSLMINKNLKSEVRMDFEGLQRVAEILLGEL